MKRRQLVFVSAVFSAVLTGFILERQRDDDPSAYISITAPSRVELPPVELRPDRQVEKIELRESGAPPPLPISCVDPCPSTQAGLHVRPPTPPPPRA